MILNNKMYMQWEKEDIQIIIGDINYRESDKVDYKVDFSFLECRDKNERDKKKEEFKNDICSFANANGGYLIFGIEEKKGIPIQITGINIQGNNTDRFELSLRNIINQIIPMSPMCQIKFINIEEKYIVIVYITKGYCGPYVSGKEGSYRFLVRRGNSKTDMRYDEVKRMFNQSLMLSEQIEQFRYKRINMCNNKDGIASTIKYSKFALVHTIPETALDNSFLFNPYDVFSSGSIKLGFVFNCCSSGVSMPNVDGMAFKSYDDDKYLQIFKSGIVERYIGIKERKHDSISSIPIVSIYEEIEKVIVETVRLYRTININVPIYIVISIENCKGSRSDNNFETDYVGFIDRDDVGCMPMALHNIEDNSEIEKFKEMIKQELYQSVGRKTM
ncbi:ATP-binding protein [Cellulosilyticum sp. ST5]|uniref:AlbA family DNA-binding domain-containing protein n=1 Tax=Cellulosilyticum sp. ST5 TaxID=3055805 RepID=UPI00397756D2